jgi:hypothetical protein
MNAARTSGRVSWKKTPLRDSDPTARLGFSQAGVLRGRRHRLEPGVGEVLRRTDGASAA